MTERKTKSDWLISGPTKKQASLKKVLLNKIGQSSHIRPLSIDQWNCINFQLIYQWLHYKPANRIAYKNITNQISLFLILVIILRVRRLLILLPAVRKFKIIWGRRREASIRPRHFSHYARSIHRHIPRIAVGCWSTFRGDTSRWHIGMSSNTNRVRCRRQLWWYTVGCGVSGYVEEINKINRKWEAKFFQWAKCFLYWRGHW